MTKLLGGILIMAAAAMAVISDLRQRRRSLMTLRELRQAMVRLTTAIRWQQMPLPDAIAARTEGPYTGNYFSEIGVLLKRGTPLPTAWQQVFQNLDAPLQDILCQVSLQGDSEQLLRQLTWAENALLQQEQALQQEDAEQKKLTCALTFSGGAMLVILML